MQSNRPMPRRNQQQPRDPDAPAVSHYRMLPKRSQFSQVTIPDPKKAVNFLTNYYPYTQAQAQMKLCVHTYAIDAVIVDPSTPNNFRPMPPDNSKAWDQIVKKIAKKVGRALDIITYRNNTIWAMKKVTGQLKDKMMIGPRGRSTNVQIKMKHTSEVDLSNVYDENNKSAKPAFVQMINNKVKQILRDQDYADLGKGKYYANAEINKKQAIVTSNGLCVTKGFKLTLLCLAPQKNFMLIDSCTRIMQTQTFLDVLQTKRCSAQEANSMFRGATVIARYGNHRTYKIEAIDFQMTPSSTFMVGGKGQEKKCSYIDYFKGQYQIEISSVRQPLLRVIARVDNKMEKKGKQVTKSTKGLYIIPELVSLVGMSDDQRRDYKVMREIATETRLRPIDRFNSVADLIKPLISQGKMAEVQKNPWTVEGFKLETPVIQLGEQAVKVDANGEFNFKQRVRQPMEFRKQQWLFAYSSYVQQADAEHYFFTLQQASQVFGIKFELPTIVRVNYEEDPKGTSPTESWLGRIHKAVQFIRQKHKAPARLVLMLTKDEAKLYNTIKKYCTIRLRIKSQFFKTATLDKKAMSAAGKIGLQIVAKEGNSLWMVPQLHSYWKGKRVAMASLSYSKNVRHSFTIALVGTVNAEQTDVYSECMGELKGREHAPARIYQNFFRNWLETYLEKEGSLPTTIILYREGLSDDMIKKTTGSEIDYLCSVLKYIRQVDQKFANYHPELVIFTVNKKVSTRFYDFSNKDSPPVRNPTSGSVVFNHFASSDMVDFYLVAQKVNDGTATPTQYRLVYYHPGGAPIDPQERDKPLQQGEKHELPLHALAQITYQQCFNYYNWQGAVKVPAVMQCASKVSKLVGEHIKDHVNLVRFEMQAEDELSKMEGMKEDERSLMLKNLRQECRKILSSYYFL